jgi:hypothetical protein
MRGSFWERVFVAAVQRFGIGRPPDYTNEWIVKYGTRQNTSLSSILRIAAILEIAPDFSPVPSGK